MSAGVFPRAREVSRERHREDVELARAAAEAHGVPLPIVLGRRRSKSVGIARAAAAAALRSAGWPLQRIGRFLGRDHSTVIYLLRLHAWREANRVAALAALPEVWTEILFKVWDAERRAKRKGVVRA